MRARTHAPCVHGPITPQPATEWHRMATTTTTTTTPLLDQNYLGVNLWWFYFVSRTSRSQYICVFRRSEWKWLKEQTWKSSQILQFQAHFCRNCKFLFSYMESGPGGIFWPWLEKIGTVEHPERVVSFKKEAERGWKSGVTSLSWKSGWKPWTRREFWHQRI